MSDLFQPWSIYFQAHLPTIYILVGFDFRVIRAGHFPIDYMVADGGFDVFATDSAGTESK